MFIDRRGHSGRWRSGMASFRRESCSAAPRRRRWWPRRKRDRSRGRQPCDAAGLHLPGLWSAESGRPWFGVNKSGNGRGYRHARATGTVIRDLDTRELLERSSKAGRNPHCAGRPRRKTVRTSRRQRINLRSVPAGRDGEMRTIELEQTHRRRRPVGQPTPARRHCCP